MKILCQERYDKSVMTRLLPTQRKSRKTRCKNVLTV